MSNRRVAPLIVAAALLVVAVPAQAEEESGIECASDCIDLGEGFYLVPLEDDSGVLGLESSAMADICPRLGLHLGNTVAYLTHGEISYALQLLGVLDIEVDCINLEIPTVGGTILYVYQRS